MARKKEAAQKSSSAADAAPPAPHEVSTNDVAPQAPVVEAPIEDTLPDQFFEKGSDDSRAENNDPAPPPVEAPPVRYVALTMVKVKGRYYSPGNPLPPEALDEEYIEAFLAANTIAPEQAQS